MGAIELPGGMTNQQQAALAQIQAQEQAVALLGLDVAKHCLTVTLQRELQRIDDEATRLQSFEFQRRQHAARVARKYSQDDEDELVEVEFPPRPDLDLNLGRAVDIANFSAQLLLQSRGMQVAPWHKVSTPPPAKRESSQ